MLGLVKYDDRPAVEPPLFWLVAFHTDAATWWVRAVPGVYKHVSVIGFYRHAKTWMLYDPTIWGARSLAFADNDAGLSEMTRWIDDALVVKMPAHGQDIDALRARPARGLGLGRLGFWCVPAVRHLIGVVSGALLPDRLLRDCLVNGGVIVARPGNDPHDEDAESASRSRVGKPEGGFQSAEA